MEVSSAQVAQMVRKILAQMQGEGAAEGGGVPVAQLFGAFLNERAGADEGRSFP